MTTTPRTGPALRGSEVVTVRGAIRLPRSRRRRPTSDFDRALYRYGSQGAHVYAPRMADKPATITTDDRLAMDASKEVPVAQLSAIMDAETKADVERILANHPSLQAPLLAAVRRMEATAGLSHVQLEAANLWEGDETIVLSAESDAAFDALRTMEAQFWSAEQNADIQQFILLNIYR